MSSKSDCWWPGKLHYFSSLSLVSIYFQFYLFSFLLCDRGGETKEDKRAAAAYDEPQTQGQQQIVIIK